MPAISRCIWVAAAGPEHLRGVRNELALPFFILFLVCANFVLMNLAVAARPNPRNPRRRGSIQHYR